MRKKYVIANELPVTIYVVPGPGANVDVEFTLFSRPPRNLLRPCFDLHHDEYFEYGQPVERVYVINKIGRDFHTETIENDEKRAFILKHFLAGNN